ncbi:MAG TPA: 3-oxoacyl-ACP synthase [Dysgonomonas sp.]|nr:3-oxoacyl-ACP synthase [Dysgonomonas sp.]
MYINAAGYYVPETRISNEYFTLINGITSDWIQQRTGIMTRSRASEKETINYMCRQAVEDAIPKLPYHIGEVDLIIFASYSPSDTVGTTAHYIQRDYGINNAKAFFISSACSSAINAMEIISSFFESGISQRALLICGDRNTSYSDETDPVSGHLWGDAAAAIFFSKEAYSEKEPDVIDVITQGLGHVGQGPQGVLLDLVNDGIQMPYGKDVFLNACTYMAKNTKEIVEKNGYCLNDLSYFIGHQANMRILKNVVKQLDIPENKILSNIEQLGNTGSVSSILVYAQNQDKFEKEDLVCISVFGGGYSAGACLIRF